ncbi:MAG: hypothetical protein ACRCUY_13905 [Thermoguttaceae bacterium]
MKWRDTICTNLHQLILSFQSDSLNKPANLRWRLAKRGSPNMDRQTWTRILHCKKSKTMNAYKY